MRLHAFVLAGLWLTGLAACGAWWFASGQATVVHGCVGVAVSASGAIAIRDWMTTPAGILLWDGKDWAWVADGQVAIRGHVTVSIDFQRWMLLRFVAVSGGVNWLWAYRAGRGAQWRGLRRALFARQVAGESGEPGWAGESGVDPSSR